MEPALKQRLIGAMVLVALAVIFLPMLIKGPAPESGASDVPLKLPDAPQGQYETRELPLVTPGDTPRGGAVGMDTNVAGSDTLPTVDTSTAAAVTADGTGSMMPAATAGGDYAVNFGSYANPADAARVIAALAAAKLPGYQEAHQSSDGRTLYRVRIGPYAAQADAEAARLRAGRVRDDVGAKVVVLNAATATPVVSTGAPAASVAQPLARAAASVSAPVALAESKPVAAKPLPSKPATPPPPVATATKPVVEAPKPAAPTKPAAADTGFAVQLGAFGSAAEANKLRDRARAAGFSAFVQDVRTDKGTLSRVRIGPVVTRADADQLKTQVSAKLGVSGIVQPHP